MMSDNVSIETLDMQDVLFRQQNKGLSLEDFEDNGLLADMFEYFTDYEQMRYKAIVLELLPFRPSL